MRLTTDTFDRLVADSVVTQDVTSVTHAGAMDPSVRAGLETVTSSELSLVREVASATARQTHRGWLTAQAAALLLAISGEEYEAGPLRDRGPVLGRRLGTHRVGPGRGDELRHVTRQPAVFRELRDPEAYLASQSPAKAASFQVTRRVTGHLVALSAANLTMMRPPELLALIDRKRAGSSGLGG